MDALSSGKLSDLFRPLAKQAADSLYIACWLPPAQAAALALDGGEPAEKLHVTLCCIPNDDGDPLLPELVRMAAATVARQTAPLSGSVGGLGVFSGDESDALYGSVDMVGLVELRASLVTELERHGLPIDETHGFAPHVTLAYVEPGSPVEIAGWQPLPLSLDSLAVVTPDTDNASRVDIPFATVAKEALHGVRPDLHLQVIGVHRAPDDANLFIYRTASADGHYVGRTQPTRIRASKGDVLTVAPAELSVDQQGDVAWTEPEVITRYGGRADSQRQIRSLVTKEQPTSADVHIDAPLGSTGKKRKKKDPALSVLDADLEVRVAKLDPARQLVYGVVLEPHVEDSQGDWETPEEIEKAAHLFLERQTPLGLQHRALAPETVRPVESFIAPVDFSYPENPGEMITKGSWVVVGHIADEGVWKGVEDGLFNAWSIAGTGRRSHEPIPQ